MLTPQMIAEANKVTGWNVPSTAGSVEPPVESRSDEMLRIGREAQAKLDAEKPRLGQGAIGEFGSGIIASGVKTGAQIEKGLDQTLGRVGNAIAGNGFTPTHTGEVAEKTADSIINQSSYSQAGNAVGVVAPYLLGAGESEAAAGLLPKVIQAGGNIAKNTAIATAQTGNLGEGLETGVGGELLSGAARPLQSVAKGIYKSAAIPTSKAEAKLVQTYNAKVPFMERVASALKGESKGPVTAADTAFRKGLFGTESMVGTQAKRASDALWENGIKPALQNSDVKINMPQFFSDAEKQIVKDNPELSRQSSLKEALNSLKEDYQNVKDVPIEKLQDFKKGWAKNVPEKAYQGKDIAGAFNDVKNIVAAQARKHIYDALGPEMKQAYIDHGNLQSLAEWGQKSMTGAKFKGGTGSLLSAAKDAVLTPITTIGTHVLYKTANGLEFIGVPGARYLATLFNDDSQ